jgi:predicted RNA-binding Zn ribbon-like protein
VADGGAATPVNVLLQRYPPDVHVSDHDVPGSRHLHFARDGEDPLSWLGRSCAAALAQVICGDPEVAVGRCEAKGCPRFYVDQSRNRSRRFCSAACASRTTVAAYRARQKTDAATAASGTRPLTTGRRPAGKRTAEAGTEAE